MEKFIDDITLGIEEGDLIEFRTNEDIVNEYDNTWIRVSPFMYNEMSNRYLSKYLHEGKHAVKMIRSEGGETRFLSSHILYPTGMEERIAGLQAIVKYVNEANGRMAVGFLGDKNYANSYTFCTGMAKIVKKNYTEELQERRKEMLKMNEQAIPNEAELIKEMIEKVDVKNMKRILSACLQRNAKDIVGIPKLLEEWAHAKKHIYLLFGKQLRITIEKDFKMNVEERKILLNEILNKFPRRRVSHKFFGFRFSC